MTTYILSYLILFYLMYFLGHFAMSMAYGLGPSAAPSTAAVLFGAVVVTLWKAAGRSEDKKEIVWGIVAGFFLWCFFGEFLEHDGIIALVTPESTVLLVPCLLIISYLIYRKAVPIGMRFALGHFGCVWLLHSILVNQVEGVQSHNPAVYAISLPVTGLVFLLIFLVMLFKTVRAGSEKTRLAYLLPSFIFLWATMETLQAMDFLPDYTCYAYWKGGYHSASPVGPMEEAVDKKIALIKGRYAWKDQQAEKHAYALIKRLPSPHFIDDFAARLEQQLGHEGEQQMEGKLFYRVMEESFVKTTASAFDHLLGTCIQQFKAATLSDLKQHVDYADYSGGDASREDVEGKIAFIKERYTWENSQTRELAGRLLNRFSIQFLTGDDFIKRLDEKLAKEKTDTLSEEMFCRVMKEYFAATTRTIFVNLIKTYVQQAQGETT